MTTGLVLARIRASDYQAVVDKAQGSRDESSAAIDAAEAQLAEAQAGLTQAESDFGRIATLWQQESVTKPAYDASKARLDVARAKVDAAIASVAAAQQRATAAAAQLQEARIALGDTELRAPFDAVLLERHVDVGTLVSPGTPAFTIADLHLVKARFSVPDTALHMFRAGQPLRLTVDAFANERFQGQVLSVALAADPKARSFEITVAIDNPTLKLRSGMIASIRVADDGRIVIRCAYRSTHSSMIPLAINTSCTPWSRRTEASPLSRPFMSARTARGQSSLDPRRPHRRPANRGVGSEPASRRRCREGNPVSVARFFVENRHVSWVLLVGVIAWGIWAYAAMPKRKDPTYPFGRWPW